MQIQSINIERFGRKQNVFVDGIADQLNVIYGGNGSGKSTTVHFIRWMLYGNCDELTKRYVSGLDRTAVQQSAGTAAGALSFVENGRRRSMSRQDDGSRYGRVALDGGSHYAKQANHLVSLLGDVSQADFDLLFAPNLDREHGLSSLLQSSFARGIDLTSQRIPSEKVQELRLRIDHFRSDMDQLPFTSGDLSQLLDRKRAVERKIDEVEHESRRRKEEYDREFQEVTRRIQDSELEINRLRTDWHSRDEQVAARRRELEEAWRVADQAKQEYLARRRNDLADIEANIARARSMQSDVQHRRDRLEATLRNAEVSLDRNPQDLKETVCLVQSIARQLDDIKQDNATVAETVTPYRSVYRYHGSPPSTSTSIDALRSQVGRLCDTLQHERSEDRVRAMAAELDELRQTDAAMDRWVRGLVAQQSHIQRELDEANRFGISLVVDQARKSIDGVSSLANVDPADLQLLDNLETGRLRAVGHTCDGYEPVHPENDALLRQLIQQRDASHEALQAAERELRQLMDRRRDLEGALSRLSLQDLEMARRELAEIEVLIRAAEERDRLLREISALEDEIARLKDSVRNSPVTQHAEKILKRLTRGRYRSIRIDNTRDVSVEDESEAMVPVEHLSRGIRDQVYLSFCLAIITAYRKRGVELPFILNDAFTNVDSEKDDTLGSVLREFANSGQQVLVFTRHHYVANLLRNLGARYLELGTQAVQAVPVATTEVDHVRFRPRSEGAVANTSSFVDASDYPPSGYVQQAYSPQSFAPQPYPTQPRNYVRPVAPTNVVRQYSQPQVSQSYVQPVRTADFDAPRPRRAATVHPTVWDDGISDSSGSSPGQYSQYPSQGGNWGPQSQQGTRRVVANMMHAAEYELDPTPFEDVTFSNEVPFQSFAQTITQPVRQSFQQTVTQQRPATPRVANVAPARPMARTATVDRSISRATSLDTTGTMDSSAASRLRAAGIVSVGDFLELAPAVAEEQMRKWGLDARPIRRWQDQLSLRCDLDGVEADDARLLVACGVCGIRDLADADLDVLCERIGHLLSTQRSRSGARRSLRAGSYPRDRVAAWIRAAANVRARRSNSRRTGMNAEIAPPYESDYDPDYVYSDPQRAPRTDFPSGRQSNRHRDLTRAEYAELEVDRPADYDNDGYYSDVERDRQRNSREGRDLSRSGRSSLSRTARSSRTSRSGSNGGSSSSRSSSSGSSRSSSDRSSSSRSSSNRGSSRRSNGGERSRRSSRSSRSSERKLRFYLERSAPVVDAPTIGPKTAKKLIAIGVGTVDDLLRSNPATLANKLNDSRIDAAIVTTWIQQATLACRIPQLRGHDAQILVACGISDPDTLAAMDPDDLWKIVRPFVKTSECKRIIRNGKAPDREEIGEWIEWAQSSRSLQAA